MEILELESIITEMKNSLEWLSSRFEQAEGSVSNLGNRWIETKWPNEQKEKERMKKKITDLQKGGTPLNIQHMHTESARRMAKNFSNLMKNPNLWIPSRINSYTTHQNAESQRQREMISASYNISFIKDIF